MAEVKFIFTADDSQLQNAIARVEKSLGNVGISSSAAAKSAGEIVDDVADSMSNVGEKVKSAAELFAEYDKKVVALSRELSSLKTQLENLPIGAEKEKVKEITDEIANVNAELEKYKNLRNEAGAQNLQDSGISFTLVTQEPIAAENTSSGSTESEAISSNIEQINQQTDALAKSREEYDKIIAAIKETDSSNLKLANTNDAVAATFSRIGNVSNALKLSSDELRRLNAELENAKAAGNDALAETISKQIEDVKAKIPALNKELQELVAKEEELRKKQKELRDLVKETKKEGSSTQPSVSSGNSKTSGVFSDQNWKSATASMGEFSKGLSQVTNGFKQMATGGAGAAKGLQMVTGGIKMMSKALLSLLANPIVAVISAIVLAIAGLGKALSKYFTQTSEGADKFANIKAVFNSVKIVIENFTIEVGRKVSEIGNLLMNAGKFALQVMTAPARAIVLIWKTIGNTIAGVVKGIIQGFKSGDWSKIGESVKATIGKALEEINHEVDTAKENIAGISGSFNEISGFGTIIPDDILAKVRKIERDKRNLIKEEKAWEIEKAKLDEQRSELQYVMYSGSQTEQIAAIDKMSAITKSKYAKEISLAKERLRIQQEENKLAGNNVTIENKDKENKLTIELNKLTVQQNNELRTMARRYKSVTNALLEQKKASEKDLLNQQRENEKIGGKNKYSAEVDMLKLRIKYENDANKKLELQRELRKTNLEYQLQELEAQKKLAIEQNEIDKKSNIKKVYGENALEEYEKTGTLKNDTEGRLDYYNKRASNIEKKYTLLTEGAAAQSSRDGAAEDLDNSLTRFETYLQGMLDAEQAYQEEMQSIRARYGIEEGKDVSDVKNESFKAEVASAETARTQAQNIVKRETGLEDEKMVTDLANLGAKVANMAKEEIRKEYDAFIQEVTNQIEEIESLANNERDVIKSEQTLQAENEAKLAEVNTKLEGSGLTPDEEVNLLAQKAQLEADIELSKEIQANATQRLNELTKQGVGLTKVRKKAEETKQAASAKALTAEEKQQQKVLKQTKASKDALLLVRDAADGIANTFGGALSQKGKKALNTMAEIADFGIQAVEGIETIVNGTTKGMQTTAEGASKAIQTAEKASFILTIISLAVQMVMKIVEIASQFTKGAQLQDAIDAHIEKVDELKKQQQLIEAQYATSQGSEYFLGMAKAAKSYEGIIDETNAALKDATELYEHYASKNADSDKAKEAKEQMQDLQQQRQEEINAQIEAERELMEGLSGTSLESFTSTLADSLIEGFKNGTDGIEDAWEDTMKNLKETMFREQLALALQDQFKDAFETLQKSTADGEMSESDMAAFLAEMEKAEANAKAIGEAYYTAFQESGLLDDADAEGSEGFGQMTQDQADTLTARFTAVQMEMANVSVATQAMAGIVTEVGTDIKAGVASIQSLLYNSNIALQIAQDQLDQMQVIADNTAMLNETNNRLKAIEQNTSKL